MHQKISQQINNQLDWQSLGDRYFAGILGESPSKGARSPVLWNAAFNVLEMPVVYFPFDVAQDNLEGLVSALRENDRFIGGSVTMPHKIQMVQYLDEIEQNASRIGAVNAFVRTSEGRLVGYNTDGAGFIASLDEAEIDLQAKKVLIIGVGGAAKAVALYTAERVGKEGELLLYNRRTVAGRERLSELAESISQNDLCHVNVLDQIIDASNDVIINCTSVGSSGWKKNDKGVYTLEFMSPLSGSGRQPYNDAEECTIPESEISDLAKQVDWWNMHGPRVMFNNEQSLRYIQFSSRTKIFIDIVYNPAETVMLRQARMVGRRTLNGKAMNLHQAVIAFMNATQNRPELSRYVAGNYDRVKDIMNVVP